MLTRVDDDTAKKIVASLTEYCETIPIERRFMLKRYQVVDIVHRIVGVGSVGTRAYLLLLFGTGDEDPLFLQVRKQVMPHMRPICRRFRLFYSTTVAGSLRHSARCSLPLMFCSAGRASTGAPTMFDR